MIRKVDNVEKKGRHEIVREIGDCREDGQLRDFQLHVVIRGLWHQLCIKEQSTCHDLSFACYSYFDVL